MFSSSQWYTVSVYSLSPLHIYIRELIQIGIIVCFSPIWEKTGVWCGYGTAESNMERSVISSLHLPSEPHSQSPFGPVAAGIKNSITWILWYPTTGRLEKKPHQFSLITVHWKQNWSQQSWYGAPKSLPYSALLLMVGRSGSKRREWNAVLISGRYRRDQNAGSEIGKGINNNNKRICSASLKLQYWALPL